MRLTLRTLLSYRDGVLSAKDQEELGQKLRASATAQGIARRMDAARVQIKLPRYATEPGLQCNANDMSEFLDDVLESDRLFEMERICLKEDALLSEVASVHTILAKEFLPSGSRDGLMTVPTQELMTRLYGLHDPEDRYVVREGRRGGREDGVAVGSLSSGLRDGSLRDGSLREGGALRPLGGGDGFGSALDEEGLGGLEAGGSTEFLFEFAEHSRSRLKLQLIVLGCAFVVAIFLAVQDGIPDRGAQRGSDVEASFRGDSAERAGEVENDGDR